MRYLLISVMVLLMSVSARAEPRGSLGMSVDREWDTGEAFVSKREVYCALLVSRLAKRGSGPTYVKKTERSYASRMKTCMEIAYAAEARNLGLTFVLSLAWEEAKFDSSAVSDAGAYGPLQVLPKYWCPKRRLRGCNLIEAGLDAIEMLSGKYETLYEVACHYNGGVRCNKYSKAYAMRILAMQQRLEIFHRWLIEYGGE